MPKIKLYPNQQWTDDALARANGFYVTDNLSSVPFLTLQR